MKIIIIMFCFILVLSGCSSVKSKLIKSSEDNAEIKNMAAIDDISGWDISIDEVDYVYLDEHKKDQEPFFFTLEDGIRLVEAFNAIQNKNIYPELTKDEKWGGYPYPIIVQLKSGEKIKLGYEPFCILQYNHLFYYTDYQIEYYDVIRELAQKYGFKYIDWEEYLSSSEGYGAALDSHLILSPDKEVSDVYTTFGFNKKIQKGITFTDILNKYSGQLELNDVVETDDMLIKVIEIKENQRVTAIAVQFKDFGIEQ